MSRILITGAGSYIGTSFEKYIKELNSDYTVDTVDMTKKNWKEKDFSKYDVVFHVAGIAHIKEDESNKALYYEVNHKLAVETAKKAKEEGVKQFIFLSSMSVYGMETGVITKDTIPQPISNYGKSKLMAEKDMEKLRDSNYKLAIVRPPMIYGEGCKGNYNSLVKFAKIMPLFPYIDNQRSMLHIDNLNIYIKKLIDEEKDGLYFPQDEEYVCTSEMVKDIANEQGKEIKLTRVLNGFVYLAQKMPGKIGKMANKAFGNLIYSKNE